MVSVLVVQLQNVRIMLSHRPPRWDRHRSIFLKIGFIGSLAFCFMAFNYTSYSERILAVPSYEPDEDIGEVIPPRIPKEKKVLPPPKPTLDLSPLVEDLPDPVFTDELPPEPVDAAPDADAVESTEDPVTVPTATPAPKVELIAPPAEEEEGPVIFAERMPVMIGCDLDLSESDRRACTQRLMLEHIYEELHYPSMARDAGIQGTVVASIIVDKTGSISSVDIIKDIGGGCGQEVKKVVSTLGDFHPGRQNGRPVAVIYRIPVRFTLQR